MVSKYWTILVSVGILMMVGCTKKPPPTPEPEPAPPVIEQAEPEPAPSGPSEEELRRQRIQARIAETFRPIYFSYDQSTITDESKRTLQAIGALMKEVPEITARVEGHADERGTNEYNLALGEQRANSVKNYLSSYGVTGTRLNTISYGEEQPSKDGTDESAWALNRRAEFTTSF